jgi:hypothetical protein
VNIKSDPFDDADVKFLVVDNATVSFDRDNDLFRVPARAGFENIFDRIERHAIGAAGA